MVIQARMMLGGITAIAVLGATVWVCMPRPHATVEVKQLDPASWSVQVTELGTEADDNKTAAATR
jgi:hypothetical protein